MDPLKIPPPGLWHLSNKMVLKASLNDLSDNQEKGHTWYEVMCNLNELYFFMSNRSFNKKS